MADSALTDPRYRFAADICIAFFFALEVCLAIHTIVILICDITRSRKRKLFFITFIALILTLQSMASMGWIVSTEEMLVEKPGETTATEDTWRNLAGVLSILLTEWFDALLLMYRCYIIWGQNIRVIILPILMFFAITALGITAVIQTKTTFSFTSSIVLHVWLPTGAAFLLLMTTLISFRIISAWRALLRIGGSVTELQSNYIGIISILVEAALPFSVLCIITSVALIRNWDCLLILLGIWGTCAGIVPILIIHRVAKGTAWSDDNNWTTRNVVSDIRFEMQIGDPVPGELRSGFELTTKQSSSFFTA